MHGKDKSQYKDLDLDHKIDSKDDVKMTINNSGISDIDLFTKLIKAA